MRERPILFNAPMVRAILGGWKTQTRRVVKPQPTDNGTGRWSFVIDATDRQNVGTFRFGTVDSDGHTFTDRGKESSITYHCPYGRPGDRLWVRETWGWIGEHHHKDHRSIYWKAERSDWLDRQRWKPSIHMPRWASRVTLEITDVRVERVQDISEDDARVEGAAIDEYGFPVAGPPIDDGYDSCREWFADLWDSINAKRGYSWESNQWVWVVAFRRMR